MKEKNWALIPAALLISGRITFLVSAIFGLFVVIAFVNSGIGLSWDLLELLGSDPGAGRDRGSGYTAGHEQDRSGMAA